MAEAHVPATDTATTSLVAGHPLVAGTPALRGRCRPHRLAVAAVSCVVVAAALAAGLLGALLGGAGGGASGASAGGPPSCGAAVGNGVGGACVLRVLGWNIYGGGEVLGVPLAQVAAAIGASGADLVGLQETRQDDDGRAVGVSVASAVAAALGWYCLDQAGVNNASWAQAVVSRWPLALVSDRQLAVRVGVPGHEVYITNVHLADYPYQPFQLMHIPYGTEPFLATADEAVAAAVAARGSGLEVVLAEIAGLPPDATVFLTGDFNEPSALDWTPAAVSVGQQPLPVPWPTSRALAAAGFVDAFRAAHADPVAAPGMTWTPMTSDLDPKDHHDRIDFVYVRGGRVAAAEVVGEDARFPVWVSPFPSDHRGVVATVTLAAAA